MNAINFLKGTGVAIVTPFKADEELDYDSLAKVIEHIIQGGVEYIVTMGTTGETATLFEDEIQPLLEFTKKQVNGRIPIVLGIGGNDTWDVKEVIKRTNFDGISAILSVSPYYNRPQQEGIYQHFKQIAEISPLPIILYNVPSRTGSNMKAETIVRLARDCKNIVAVKEASGSLMQFMEIIKNKPQDFLLISGDDALALPAIACGASGVISVVANVVPKTYSDLIRAALAMDFTTARSLQYRTLDLINALFREASPSGIKAALEIKGLCESHLRLPMVKVTPSLYTEIKRSLQDL